MKKIPLLFAAALLAAFSLLSTGCDKELFCEGKGTLTVSNSSSFTIHQVLIDGAVYATLYPGESEDIKLAAGKYTVEFIGINGGGGCYPSKVTLDACGEEFRGCSY